MGHFSSISPTMKTICFVLLSVFNLIIESKHLLVQTGEKESGSDYTLDIDSCPKGKPTPGTGCKAPLPNDCLYEDQAFDCIEGKWTRVLKEGDECFYKIICSQQDDLKCKTDPACGGVLSSYCRKSDFEVPKLNCTNRCTGCLPKPFLPAPAIGKCPKKQPTVGNSCTGRVLCNYKNEVEEESDTLVECIDGKWALFNPGTGLI